MILALTGATGFIGRPLLARLLADGHRVRALARDPARLPARPELEAVPGDLLARAPLDRLVEGADLIIHLAGLVSALRAEAFTRVNETGSRLLAEAVASHAPDARVILVSSLAAREPGLSAYARSKRGGEEAFAGLGATIVRPPAVYGPGDRGTLPIFQQLAKGWLTAPRAECRFAMIFVDDLVGLLVSLADRADAPPLVEPDDGAERGYGWPDLAGIAGRAMGRPVRLVRLPRAAFELVATAATGLAMLQRRPPLVDRGKVAELFHPDWLCRKETTLGLDFQPAVKFETGFARTLEWYRSAGLI